MDKTASPLTCLAGIHDLLCYACLVYQDICDWICEEVLYIQKLYSVFLHIM